MGIDQGDRARAPMLLGCKKCGGRAYAYDMRGSGTHELCTVECGDCDHDEEGGTPEEAAEAWNRRD